VVIVAIPRVLREKLGDDGVDALIEIINKSGEGVKEDVISLSEERFERRLSEEIAKLREEIAGVRAELKEEISGVRGEIAGVREELKIEIARVRANLIQWMFIFWVGQIGALLGILFAFFR
jgi:hypothetical protein